MGIAYTTACGAGATDILLTQVAEELIKFGRRPVGVVQTNTERLRSGPCDMDVKVLPSGPTIRISQSLGCGAKGCRLDPHALETAVGLVEEQLRLGADCLIVNKFGKHEAEGRGFRNVLAEAVVRDIPVLVGLHRLNAEAFHAFTDGLASNLEADETNILSWLATEMGKRRHAA